MRKVWIGRIGFDDLPMEEAAIRALQAIERKEKCVITTPNAEFVYACRSQDSLRELINRADLVLPDGIGIVLASRILGTPVANRLPGVDFAAALMEKMAPCGYRLFLLGAKPGVAEQAARRLIQKYPGLDICGTMDGYFSDEREAVDRIIASGAQAVFVCMGFPKQEQFCQRYKDQLPAHVLVGLGGSLDVFSGQVKRAPVFYQRCGLEWLYRLLKEPARIKRMKNLPLFLLAVIKDRVMRRPQQ